MTALRMKSKISKDARMELYLDDVEISAELKPDEVVIEVGAAPINPSDQGVMFGPADISAARTEMRDGRPVLTAPVPEAMLSRLGARLDKGLPVGNEGAGTVVAAGSSDAAQALMGRVVAAMGGMMYSQKVKTSVQNCLVLNEGTAAVDAASCFVNPLTALSMTETMKLEGHKALVHTAAASNLGQMLVRICKADGINLVNIVRSEAQEKILRDLGAKYVLNSTADNFNAALTDALAETGATLAFDAIGGGKLANKILASMEAALIRNATEYSVYGVTTHKQVYLYGALDLNPTQLTRSYGMFWGIGGWLLPPFLQRLGAEKAAALRQRVADELQTTFKSNYTGRLTLEEALDADTAKAYARKATGEKYLICPNGK
ncbi:zinc-binding dehydrogenase [Pacificimonas sp. WHA3]|uniref:Zinc-binding dehydrogenase n=1 Tax=Pacificimonas pallii TaxID=2827236 RepID=A0ABS6SC89_9SPHN|nr:zinc-binding dehydrogenase [Pacificimonas pallii]MBV7256033.1 zinc-binding dehydrogenase [Pacificimonas pallii]